MRTISFARKPGEVMENRKTRAVGVDGEHVANAPRAAISRRPIEGVTRQNQARIRISSVGVNIIRITDGRKSMESPKTRAIGVDAEHRATARIAARSGSSVKG